MRLVCLVEPKDSWTCDLIRGIAESRRPGDDFRWVWAAGTEGRLTDMSRFKRDSPVGDGMGWILDASAWHRCSEPLFGRGSVVEVFQTLLDLATSDGATSETLRAAHSCGPDVERGFVEATEEMGHRGFHRFAWLGYARDTGGEAGSAVEAGPEVEAGPGGMPRALADRGAACYRVSRRWASSDAGTAASRPSEEDSLARWLETLATPVVLFSQSAALAAEAVRACRDLDIAVPDEIAVISGEDDALRCLWADPEVSRMNWVGARVGKAAVTLLREAMASGDASPREIVVPPGPVIHRRSTDTLAIADPDLAAALRYIHKHATESIRVSDLLRHVPISRRSLEQKFRATLQRSPAAEIRRVRVLRARELVERTTLSIGEIAQRCGFESCELFSRTFRQWCGMPPTAFRNRSIEGGRIDPPHGPPPAKSPRDTPQGDAEGSRSANDAS